MLVTDVGSKSVQHPEADIKRIISSYPVKAIRLARKVDDLIIETIDYQQGISALIRTYDLAGHFRNQQGCMLLGSAGSGRSHLLDSFQTVLAARGQLNPEATILQTNLDESVTRRSLVAKSLAALGYPILDMGSGVESGKQNQLLRIYMKNRGIRLWIIRNADVLVTTTARNANEVISGARHISSLVESISNELKIPLVLVGSEKLSSILHLTPDLGVVTDLEVRMGDLTDHDNWQVMVSGYTNFLEQHFDLAAGVVDTTGLTKISDFVVSSKLRFARLVMELVMVATKDKSSTLTSYHMDKAIDILNSVAIEPREYRE